MTSCQTQTDESWDSLCHLQGAGLETLDAVGQVEIRYVPWGSGEVIVRADEEPPVLTI